MGGRVLSCETSKVSKAFEVSGVSEPNARPIRAGDHGQRQHAEDDQQQDATTAAGTRGAAAEAEVSL